MMQKPEGTDLPQEIFKHWEKKSCLLRHSKSTLGHCKVQNGQKKTKSRSLRGDVSKVMESFGQMLIVQFGECSELGGNVTVPQPTLSLKRDSL